MMDLNTTYRVDDCDEYNDVLVSTDDVGPIGNTSSGSYFLSPRTVPTLTDMASFTISIALWNHINVSSFVSQSSVYLRQRKISFNVYLREAVMKLSEELPVPTSIANRIREYVFSVSIALEHWNYYHLNAVFWNTQSYRSLYSLFHHIVWYPNGRIDRVRTARNLLNSPRLSDVEKYRVLCTYCLKDELESMWPSLLSNYGVDRVNESAYPLIHYWNCYFGNKLDQVRLEENQSINSFMFENVNVDNWPAKEYFFDLFTSEEQIRIAISFIDRNDAKYQKMLLKKLDDAQRLQVYMSSGAKIISNYATEPRRNELDIRSTWFKIRNLVTREDFVVIYRCLFSSQLVSGTLLEYIWSSASYDLRSHLLNYNHHEMIGCALRMWVKKNENDFFFKMLSKSSTNTKLYISKEPFFIQSCVYLISDDKFLLFDRLLEFCFVKPEESKQFKQDIVKEEFFIHLCEKLITEDKLNLLHKSLNVLLLGNEEKLIKSKRNLSKKEFFDKLCEQLVIDSNFMKFNLLLNSFVDKLEQLKFKQDLISKSNRIKYYCLNEQTKGKIGYSRINFFLTSLLPSSPDFIVEYKKNLLMSSNGIDWWAARIDSKIDLNPIIVDSLPTPELVAEFKERLIFAPTVVSRFRSWITSSRINEFDACVNQYITSNQDRITLKKRIIGNPTDLISEFFKSNSKRTSWHALETWWPRDESASTCFKSTLPLDEIFNEMLKDCIYSKYDPAHRLRNCKLRSDLRFDSLVRFLEWYFVLFSKITEYKMRRIDAYKEIDAIKTLLKKKDVTYLKRVLSWFFESNSQLTVDFKAKKKGERILNAMP